MKEILQIDDYIKIIKLDHHQYKNVSGIYKWENKVNHKCYIGQAIDLYNRIKAHYTEMRRDPSNRKNKSILYKAIDKYSIHNFTLEILYSCPRNNCIKSELDRLEKYYIKKYNSFKDGYNMTIGGDGGMLGYKFTDEQISHCKIASKNKAHLFYKKVYLYDINTKEVKEYDCIGDAATDIKCSHSCVDAGLLKKTWLVRNKYLVSGSLDQLEIRKSDYYNHLKDWRKCLKENNGRGKCPRKRKPHSVETKNKIGIGNNKYNVYVYDTDYILQHQFKSLKDTCAFFGISSTSTFLHHYKLGMGKIRLYKDKYYLKIKDIKHDIEI